MPRALKACGSCGTPTKHTPCGDCLREKNRIRARKRGTRQELGYGEDHQRIRRAAIKRQPWCALCGLEGDPHTGQTVDPHNPLTADHDLPKSRGGQNTDHNTVVLCRRCNSSKGTRTLTEMYSHEAGP